ncbi:MAG TPA: NapC/NirT family cytochrome c [Beijerinckiaceae bacterium]|nr:NapC/NirT family cytochrome c [Beijerinckiaceae bacterium]
MTDIAEARGGLFKRLFSPTARWSVFSLLLVGGIGGVIFWGGFNTFMEYTNRLEFCISCHSMSKPLEEYKASAHYSNPSGVRAICSDCHVPKDWTAKLIRKVQATGELWHHFNGKLSTPEKFEAHRAEMATRVWASMKANDSRECRNCHSYETMAFHKQSARAREKMEPAVKSGETCIDCHKGVAHKLPPRDD